MAEFELSPRQRQCLAQRIPDLGARIRKVGAWADRRNCAISAIDWHATTTDARTRRKRRYPTCNA